MTKVLYDVIKMGYDIMMLRYAIINVRHAIIIIRYNMIKLCNSKMKLCYDVNSMVGWFYSTSDRNGLFYAEVSFNNYNLQFHAVKNLSSQLFETGKHFILRIFFFSGLIYR